MKQLHIPSLRRTPGFTLIELMIGVVIAGILLAVALPNFMDSIRKGRRSEAFTAIAAVQQAQERYRGNNPSYAATLSDLGITSPTGPGGYYALTPSSHSATVYVVTATAVTTGSQANDGSCATLSVQVNGGAIGYASCTGCSGPFTYLPNDRCWVR